jgi:L-lactate dehydrogenase complex protein LldG
VSRLYKPAGTVVPDVALFCRRAGDYRATVHLVRDVDLAATVRGLCLGRTAVTATAPCSLEGIDAVGDEPPLGVDQLDSLDSVLTGAACAIAETGTIVLDGGPACGRRVLTLLPDHHVCVVRAEQIVATVPDAVAMLSRTAPLTLISGPSATSDIEFQRVEGVHGPRRLDLVVVGAE